MERDVALMRVRFLEAEKVKVEESITRLEGELVEASFMINSAAEKDTKKKLQQRVLAVNQSYKEEITQLRRHNTLLAGQVRLLQEHIQGSSPCPPQATYVFCEMKEGNLIGVDTNEAGALK